MLRVAYWNVNKSKLNIALALQNREEFDVIAIQKPWKNRFIKGTFCLKSGKYQIIHKLGSRAAIYIYKRFASFRYNKGRD